MNDLISIPLSYEDLCDTIYYLEWKIQEVDEAGEDLEHPNIRNVLKRLEYIKSRMKYNPTDKVQEMIDQEDDEDYNPEINTDWQPDDTDYDPEFDAASYT